MASKTETALQELWEENQRSLEEVSVMLMAETWVDILQASRFLSSVFLSAFPHTIAFSQVAFVLYPWGTTN